MLRIGEPYPPPGPFAHTTIKGVAFTSRVLLVGDTEVEQDLSWEVGIWDLIGLLKVV